MYRLASERNVLFGLVAGSYTALYSRFAAQWEYLAALYNQIKAKEIDVALRAVGTTQSARAAGLIAGAPDELADRLSVAEYRLAELKNAFTVDAEHLHLANKEPFAASFTRWSKEPAVKLVAENLNRTCVA